MDKHQDNEADRQDFSLEEILAEFSSSPREKERISASTDDTPDIPEFVNRPRSPKPTIPAKPAPPAPQKRHPSRPAQQPTASPSAPSEPAPPTKKPTASTEKVIRFPGAAVHNTDEPEEDSAPLSRLLKKADDYASRMFEGDTPDPEDVRAERFLPGVDQEQPRPVLRRERAPRRVRPAAPDLPPQELAHRYGKGLSSLRIRCLLVFLLSLPLLYLAAVPQFSLPLPAFLQAASFQIWLCIGVHAAVILLSLDLFRQGLSHLGSDTLIAAAAIVTLLDSCTLSLLNNRGDALPYSLVSVLSLGFGLWGMWLKRSALRISCRTAAAAKSPYVVTLDEDNWDSRPTFTKRPGEPAGFGSQIQEPDRAMQIFRPLTPVLLLACLLFSLLATAGKGHPDLIVWALSATLCACSAFSGLLCFALPFRSLSRRLAAQGAALAGWDGTSPHARGAGILLTDTDLFPPGAISLNGLKVFHEHTPDEVVTCTATLIHSVGGGLDRPFYELLRGQGGSYAKVDHPVHYEGGISAAIQNRHVLVGSSSFLHLMDIPLPQGLNVKNAVFCAIDGELAGIFALNYALHVTIRPAVSALISNKISPILATRDFNLIPAMLLQRFKLPADKMEFPEHSRRRTLSDPEQERGRRLVCVLCREGLGPFADAVVGAKRLNRAAGLNAALSALGSVVGILITFYLVSQAAFVPLSVFNLTLFLLLWLVPILLISGWAGKY